LYIPIVAGLSLRFSLSDWFMKIYLKVVGWGLSINNADERSKIAIFAYLSY
jgi:hypothetical protein